MPYVIVNHDPSLKKKQLLKIKEVLKHSCAEALDCSDTDPAGLLTPGAINVRFWPYGSADDKIFTLDILIISMHFASRVEDLGERAAKIRDELLWCGHLNPGSRVGVFPICPPAGWAEGSIPNDL